MNVWGKRSREIKKHSVGTAWHSSYNALNCSVVHLLALVEGYNYADHHSGDRSILHWSDGAVIQDKSKRVPVELLWQADRRLLRMEE